MPRAGVLVLVAAFAIARPLFAQAPSPTAASAPAVSADDSRWTPLGLAPVDEAGAGRRGYVLPMETTDVTGPNANQFSFHTTAANNLFLEERSGFLISQRYEVHSFALGYRRGFTFGIFPRVEIGGQVQFHESDDGFLNGFIAGFEDAVVSVSGHDASKNDLRADGAVQPPFGTVIKRDGRTLYEQLGDTNGIGDFYFVVNALLKENAPGSRGARISVRAALNVAGSSAFTQGNMLGVGATLEKQLLGWMAIHGDFRTYLFLDDESEWGLPLTRGGAAYSVGPEVRLGGRTSLSLQIDGSTTPYHRTDTDALDKDYGDITLGLAHRFRAGARTLLTQLYARENMNQPLRVRWNTDPDFAIGFKATLR